MPITSKFRRPQAVLIAGLGAVALLLSGNPAYATGQTTGQTVTITIDNFTFKPAQTIVTPGTTVTWINNDDIPHTIVETQKSFRSKALDTENSFSFTFMNAGDYDYFCSLHPHMIGKVIVKPETG
jgi:plastocyanin